jgi:hypothetical protein
MTKKILISVATVTMLSVGFTGCMGSGGPDAPKHAQQDVSKAQAIQINIPIEGIKEVNEKLKYLSQAYKLSMIASNATFASEEINELIRQNAGKIRNLKKELANVSQNEQKQKLKLFKKELEATPEFKAAQEDFDRKYAKAKKELKHLGVDALKDYIVKKLDSKGIMANSKIASMGYMDKMKIGKEIAKLSDVLKQITGTIQNMANITEKGADVTYKSGEDLNMYLKNALQNSLRENLTETEAVDR